MLVAVCLVFFDLRAGLGLFVIMCLLSGFYEVICAYLGLVVCTCVFWYLGLVECVVG